MDKIFDDLISKKIKYFDFSGVDKKIILVFIILRRVQDQRNS